VGEAVAEELRLERQELRPAAGEAVAEELTETPLVEAAAGL